MILMAMCCVIPLIQSLIKRMIATVTGQFPVSPTRLGRLRHLWNGGQADVRMACTQEYVRVQISMKKRLAWHMYMGEWMGLFVVKIIKLVNFKLRQIMELIAVIYDDWPADYTTTDLPEDIFLMDEFGHWTRRFLYRHPWMWCSVLRQNENNQMGNSERFKHILTHSNS